MPTGSRGGLSPGRATPSPTRGAEPLHPVAAVKVAAPTHTHVECERRGPIRSKGDEWPLHVRVGPGRTIGECDHRAEGADSEVTPQQAVRAPCVPTARHALCTPLVPGVDIGEHVLVAPGIRPHEGVFRLWPPVVGLPPHE